MKYLIVVALTSLILLISFTPTAVAQGVESNSSSSDTGLLDGNKTSENSTNTSNNTTTTDANTSIATTDNTASESEIVCTSNSLGSSVPTEFGSLVKQFLSVIVILSGLFAVLNGTFYTTASAIRPSNEEYVKRRNLSLMYGLVTIIVLYGVTAIMGEMNSALDFSCLSPSF